VGSTTTEISTDTAAPFSASWNSGATPNGAATLIATAFDAFGNSTASAGVAVTVNNVPDTTAPTVAITAPASGTVSGTVTVSANAADNVGVAQVEFFAGATSLGVDAVAPYSVQWNTATFSGAGYGLECADSGLAAVEHLRAALFRLPQRWWCFAARQHEPDQHQRDIRSAG
jgi:hypothetical protein